MIDPDIQKKIAKLEQINPERGATEYEYRNALLAIFRLLCQKDFKTPKGK